MLNGFMFGGGFEIMFFLMFGLILTVFIVVFVQGISEWNKNNHSPKIAVEATVVSKRQSVSHHTHHNGTGHHHHSTSTSYYVTFQVNTGDRMELYVSGYEYGMLAEGDVGILTFQGTRYLGFERKF